MRIPIGTIVSLGGKILNAIGVIGKGKMTNTGLGITGIGLVAAGVTGGSVNPFDALVKIAELARDSWPHVLILIGAWTTYGGLLRKAGYKGSEDAD